MNEIHEGNRQYWDRTRASETERQSEEAGIWRRCCQEPALAFDCDALEVIRELVGDLEGKDVCIIGSGDNHAAFALAGQGAKVTSVDQSEKQLEVASRRAEELGLAITFAVADAADLSSLGSAAFDLVCSTNGFFVWIADLDAVFGEVHRILRPGGHCVFYDIHPFQRPWKDLRTATEMEKSYFDTGPFARSEEGPHSFHWTMADLLNALAEAGLSLRRLRELPAADSRYWEGTGYAPGTQPGLLDWRTNPMAGLPVWLLVATCRAGHD